MVTSSQLKISSPILVPVYLSLLLIGCLCLTSFFACEQFSLMGAIETNLPKPLTLSPNQAMLYEGESCVFAANGGVKPYTYATLVALGTINPTSGVYTAPADLGASGNAVSTIRVTDAKGITCDTLVVLLNSQTFTPLKINPQSLMVTTGTLGIVFSATGGKTNETGPAYTFEVIGSGTITYETVPTTRWVYNSPATAGEDLVQVQDALGNIALARVAVVAAEANPVIITPGAASPIVGEHLSFSITGGKAPYTYTINYPSKPSDNGDLPEPGPYQISYTTPDSLGLALLFVTDTDGKKGTAEITIIAAGPTALKLTPSQVSLKPGESCAFQPINGTPPYSFALKFGSGEIDNTGTYTAPAVVDKPMSAKVSVTDSKGAIAYALISVKIK